MKIADIFEKIKSALKKYWWYIILLIMSSVYVFVNWNDINKLNELNVRTVIFILWIALLILPLFSEIEIGSVKLKREIEQTRADVKESVGELKHQILDLKISNNNAMYVYNGQPLASKAELSQMQMNMNINDEGFEQSLTDTKLNVSDENIYLFKVRLDLEKQLSALCNFFQYGERRSMYAMVQVLIQHEVINRNTASLIREIINIANRGVHGEIVDADYILFVKRTYPKVQNALDSAYNFYSNNCCYCECPKCHYQGPSKYNNVCPKCGYVSDEE